MEAAGGMSLLGITLYFILGIVWLAILFSIYFMPTMIANKKKHLQKKAILLVNIFFGWTLLGWVVALVWAVMEKRDSADMTMNRICLRCGSVANSNAAFCNRCGNDLLNQSGNKIE